MAGHDKVCLGFFSDGRRKSTKLIDNEMHVTAGTVLLGYPLKHMQDDTTLTGVRVRDHETKGPHFLLVIKSHVISKRFCVSGQGVACVDRVAFVATCT